MTSRIACRAANLAIREVLFGRCHLPCEIGEHIISQSSVRKTRLFARNWNARTLCASHEF